MKKYLYLLFIAIIAIPISSIIPVRYGIWYSQYLMSLFFIFLAGVFKIWEFNKSLAAFAGICLLSTFFITKCSPRAIILLMHLISGCLISYGISKFDKSHRRILLRGILLIIILQVCWIIIQFFNKDPFFYSLINQKKDELVGLSGSPDQIGTFFTITCLLMLSYHPALFIIPLIMIVVSKSSFAFVSAIVSGLIYLWINNIKMFKIYLMIIFAVSLVFFNYMEKVKITDFLTRGEVIIHIIKTVNRGSIEIKKFYNETLSCNPLTGFGFGSFLTIFPFVEQKNHHFNFATEKFFHAHNDYFEIFFELGYIGIVILFILIGNFIIGFLKFSKDKELSLYFCSIIAYLLNAMGNFLSQIAVSGMLIIIFYGFYEARRRELGKITPVV